MNTLLALVVLATTCAAQDSCDWLSWGPCQMTRTCHNAPDKSYLNLQQPRVDHARKRMLQSMKEKSKLFQEREACRLAGTCPELNRLPTEGPAKCVNGMAGGYKCENIDLVSFISTEDLGYYPPISGDRSPGANDNWGWTDPSDNHEYVIHGHTGGTSFIRITPDPENPSVLGFLQTATVPSNWRDMKVVNDHAYIVSEARDHGMQVFDLTQLRGLTHDPTRRFTADARYTLVGQSHNIVGNPETGFVYIVGARSLPTSCSGGLHMVDVSEPKNPQFAGCFDEDGYVHDAECVVYHGPDSRYTGKEICLGYNEDTLTIVDVSDKSAPVMLSRVAYAGSQYTHQGWMTEDHSIALMDDELDESRGTIKNTRTMLWDISDLQNPVLRNSYYSEFTAIDHNQYVRGDYTYQSNYQAGLQLLKIDQANYDLTRVGYFDNYPPGTVASFAGSWSNYPYFASGVVPVTSIEYGMHLVRPDWDAINASLAAGTIHGHQERFLNTVGVRSQTCPGRQTRSCAAQQSC